MKKVLLTAFWCACFSPLPTQAADYLWDNQDGNGIWNDPVNWGILNNSGYNVAPTASDSAVFRRNFSPSGTVWLTSDGTAQLIRQEFSRAQRLITIDAAQIVNRTLTLSGIGAALIDCGTAGVDVTLDGTPNANGARLKLKIDGTGGSTGCTMNRALTLTISCDVSGAGGFIVNSGADGAGRLILSGVNSYSGPTTVNAGVLLVNGSTASASTVSITSGGTLGGTGLIGGPVTVSTGGTLSPGISIGTLTIVNKLTLGGDMLIEVNKSLTQSNDMVSVSGILTNSGVGMVQVLNLGAPLVTGDRFKIFNKPIANGQALHILSAGTEVWTNKLAVDGTIAVLSAANPPVTGNPTTVFNWKGAVTTDQPWKAPMQTATNWLENEAPPPGSSNVLVFQGDILVPYNWPYVDTNYGTSILIFSNNVVLNSIKVLAGSNHVMNLGSYVRQDTAMPCYFGITGEVPIVVGGVTYQVTNAFFTNALGDASCGSQTEFQCIGGRLDVYSVLTDGAGTHSRLVKSGNNTLNLTGDYLLGNDANTYTGGTIVNAGTIKMAKLPGVNCIPGDVTVNGTGSLAMNVVGGEQIADTAVVTLNDFGSLGLASQPETVGTVQGSSPNASVSIGSGILTVVPSATAVYNGGVGESYFSGAISGSGTLQKNGAGTYGMMGANSVGTLTVNAGVLKVNGNSGSGPVTVNSGATLLGAGTIAGTVTIAAGATIGAGFSTGVLSLSGGLNLSAGGVGATNVWQLAALQDGQTGVAGTDYDQIIVAGSTLSLGPQSTLDIQFIGSATAPDSNAAFWQSAHSWTNILVSGGSNPGASNFGRLKNANYPTGNFTTSVNANGSIVLTYQPVVSLLLWGDNTWGQSAWQPWMNSLIAISAGAYHNLGLHPDGTVVAWGSNENGQCDVPGTLTDALAIAAGGYHSLAIRANGTVRAWGATNYAQTTVPSSATNVIGISAGTWHSLALRADGRVVVWGDNTYGQRDLPAGLSNVVAVAAGGNHSLALLTNGTVVGWGENTDAQGQYAGQATPPPGLSNVVGVAAGWYHSLALLRDGTVVAWGDNSEGQCAVPTDLSNVVSVVGGRVHSLALRSDGSVVAWGANWNGQCSLPSSVTGSVPGVVAVGAGAYHSLALLAGAVPVPKLLSPVRQGTSFSSVVQTLNRKSYALESRNTLAASAWTPVVTNTGNGALRLLRDPSASGPARYYRMRQW